MKKGFVVILTGLFLLTGVVAISHAASVDWDKIWTTEGVAANNPSGDTNVQSGGTHFYEPPGGGGPGGFPDPENSDASGGYGDTVTDTLAVTWDDTSRPKTITWTYDSHAETGSRADGVTHNTAQRYSINDPLAAVSAGSMTNGSNTRRSFLPIGRGDITFTADLTNLGTWLNSNWDFEQGTTIDFTNVYYHAWRVQGSVQIMETTLDDNGVESSIILPDRILLDSLILQGTAETTLTDSKTFTPTVNNETYYELLVELSAQIVVNNKSLFPSDMQELPMTSLEIGTWSNPLDLPVELNVDVTQQTVPIPGSLMLLTSGLVGVIIRRKMATKP